MDSMWCSDSLMLMIGFGLRDHLQETMVKFSHEEVFPQPFPSTDESQLIPASDQKPRRQKSQGAKSHQHPSSNIDIGACAALRAGTVATRAASEVVEFTPEQWTTEKK